MKQTKLLKEIYAASLTRNAEERRRLREIEFQKIINRKNKGKPFNPKWTLADGL